MESDANPMHKAQSASRCHAKAKTTGKTRAKFFDFLGGLSVLERFLLNLAIDASPSNLIG